MKYLTNEFLGKRYLETLNTDFYEKKFFCEKEKSKVIAVYKNILIFDNENEIIYEPYIKEKMGLSQSEKLLCLYEKTCGSVLFTYKDGKRVYLLIKNESGHIGFPKGHIELNEDEEQTAKREVFEETGFSVELIDNFRMEYVYTTLENTIKTCVYFLSEYEYSPAKIQESEILQSWLVPFDEAVDILNFEQDREILRAAEKRLNS